MRVKYVGLRALQDGFDPLETLESFETRYLHYEECQKVIGTPESITKLKNWRKLSHLTGYLNESDPASLEFLVLPKHGALFMTPAIAPTLKIGI
jgi:hypothetical protein